MANGIVTPTDLEAAVGEPEELAESEHRVGLVELGFPPDRGGVSYAASAVSHRSVGAIRGVEACELDADFQYPDPGWYVRILQQRSFRDRND